jgi:hypothetical protein
MRRQHVIIGGDDADIHRLAATDRGLVITARGKAMREVAARQCRPVDALFALRGQSGRDRRRPGFRAFDDARGPADALRLQRQLTHASSLHRARPSAMARIGPQLPRRNFWVSSRSAQSCADRIDPCPLRLHFVAAHEQSLVALDQVEQEPFIGDAAARSGKGVVSDMSSGTSRSVTPPRSSPGSFAITSSPTYSSGCNAG